MFHNNIMFKTKVVNKIQIKPKIKKAKYTSENVRAFDYYNEPYANICLMARKNSGKTNVIFRAMEKCAKKGTNVYIFCPTYEMDETYSEMIKMLERKGCNVETYKHFIDEDGTDLIDNLLNQFESEQEKKDDKYSNEFDNEPMQQEVYYPPPPLLYFGDDRLYEHQHQRGNGDCRLVLKPLPVVRQEEKKEEKEEEKKNKKELLTPKNIFIFDDLSEDLRHKSVSKLITKNRHYKLKTFFSCHGINNLKPMALSSVDVFHLFPNLPEDKIEELKEKVNISFKGDNKKRGKLNELYDFATQEPYNFLYIDRKNNKYRKNFNEMIEFEE